jgi:hypothetical protein
MAFTKMTWDRNSEPDMDSYIVYLNGVKQARIPQTAVGVKPEWSLPASGSGTLTVTAMDKSTNESDMSVSVPFDKMPPAVPVNLVLV